MEVIVTNEFTHMNQGPERRPFKVLRPPEHSTAMVIARYRRRQPTRRNAAPSEQEPADLVWRALRVGSFCAAIAFAFFFLSQRNLFQRSGENLGPQQDSVQRVSFHSRSASRAMEQPVMPDPATDAKSVSGRPAFAVPEDPNLAVTSFNLAVTPQFQTVGDVLLKLNGVNASANTYDITVRTRRREFYRQDVKLDEHIPLIKNSTHGPELVVGAISPDQVFGYVSEPQRRGRRRHHRRT